MPTRERVGSLIAVLKRLDALGFPRVVRHVRDARDREVEPGVTLHAWLFQKAQPEARQFLAGRMAKAPFVEELHRRREGTSRSLFEASVESESATGAGVAHLFDAPAVGLPGVPRWEVDPLRVALVKMDEETGDLLEEVVEVIHLCRPEQVTPRARVLRERVLRAVTGGDELWTRRAELYPRIDFCTVVERQVRALTGNEESFAQVVLALSRLDAALAPWASGPLHPGMKFSVESEPTLSHGTYGPMRDFACPDGETRRFSNNWRIYYSERREGDVGGRAYVGYVGEHLPTVKYRT